MDAQSIIKDTYKTYFGRDPEQGGLDHWMKQAEGMGGDLSGLSDKIIGSAQGGDRTGVINKAYSDMFGRTAETAGADHWNSFWDKNWGGGAATKNDIWTTIGATSSGNDEKALADRLTNGNASWMTPFKDPAKADTFWQNLNDNDGAITGAATGAGNANGGTALDDILAQLKKGGYTKPASDGGSAGVNAPRPYFLDTLQGMISSGWGQPQINAPEKLNSGSHRTYFNQYMDDVFTPAAREVSDTYSRRIGDLKGAATQAGAYGDDTYSDAYSSLAANEARDLSDLKGKLSAQASDAAMARLDRDISRQMTVDSANANLQQNRLSQILQALGLGINAQNTGRQLDLQALGLGSSIDLANRQFDLESLLSMDQNQQNWISTMLGLDNYSRTWDQAAKDREYQDFWNKQIWPIYLQNLGVSWAGGVPSNQQTITTETRPGNSLISNLGAWFNA